MAFVLTFLLRRLAHGVVVVLIVSFLIFTLLRVIPGDPIRVILGQQASSQALEIRAQELGLRDPIPVQYGRFLYNLAHGDLGQSYLLGKSGGAAPSGQNTGVGELNEATRTTRADVLSLIVNALPYTLQLAGLGLLITFLVALPIGLAAGLNPGKWEDRLAFFLSSAFVSIPNFWLALVLILVVSSRLNLLPSIGYRGFAYTILPAIVLAVELTPVIIRGLSVSIAGAMQLGFVDGGVMRGLPRRQIVWKHVVRNASIPMLNLFGVQIGGLLLGGVFVVEYIFDYPGVGKLTIQAVLQRDFPIIQGVAILAAAVLVLANILVDLAATYIDRRLKY